MICPDGIGQLLRVIRESHGRTRLEQAELLQRLQDGRYFDPDNIKRWETEKRLPTPVWYGLLVSAYGVPLEEIKRAIQASKQYRRLASANVQADPEEPPVERRNFLAAGLVAAGSAIEPWGRLAAAISPRPVDTATAERLLAATAAMFTTEEHLPARMLAARLATHLETLTSLLPAAGKHRRELTVAAGETAALAGWAAYDTGDLASAAHYYETALLAGREAGHGAVTALALGYASYSANPERARDMLSAAQTHVRGAGYASARSWLAAREAEEIATLGDRAGAERAIDRATLAFDYVLTDGEPAWTSFFRRSRLDSLTVSTYARLAHSDLALAADAALANLGSDDSKVRIAVLHDVATGYVVSGDLDRGAEVGRRFLSAALGTPTTMGRQRMADLAKQLPPTDGAARQLHEEIRAALAA
ncbi:transcriptional regulator [Kitasatospora sp. NPDC001309]|uniref:transcriptional regulator n=1 Tax=Kitasatospora sp. NPDC001309 TaxID=3364013 RepID=UPI0036C2F95F